MRALCCPSASNHWWLTLPWILCCCSLWHRRPACPSSQRRLLLRGSRLCSSGDGDGGGGGAQHEGSATPQELPFPRLPTPDYEAERPQEQTPPEPDNPLPPDLPANNPPLPPQRPPDLEPPRFPPEVSPRTHCYHHHPTTRPLSYPTLLLLQAVPLHAPEEAPLRPTELPGAMPPPPPPEFQPRAPREMPDWEGDSEVLLP